MAGAGHTQECSLDRAASDARRLWLDASPPQKKFTRSCSSSISGIMVNLNMHLAPGFTPSDLVLAPVNVVVLPDPLAPLPLGESHSVYQVSSSRGTVSPCVAQRPLDFTLLLGICPSHQSTTRYRATELQPLRCPCLQS